jgi:hypothetical protein
MKVYFDLTESSSPSNSEFQQCSEQCKVFPESNQAECMQDCEKIYDDYAQMLQSRYQ